jgi:NAD-dependent dihydropyrimidine dehydrogenase PreA subunit
MNGNAIKIDYHQCIGCEKCYDLCPMDVYTWDKTNKKPNVAYEEECYFCGVCFMECPKRAIDITFPASMW